MRVLTTVYVFGVVFEMTYLAIAKPEGSIFLALGSVTGGAALLGTVAVLLRSSD